MPPPLQRNRLRPPWRPSALLLFIGTVLVLVLGGQAAKREHPARLLRNDGPNSAHYLSTVGLALEQAQTRIVVLMYVLRFSDDPSCPVRYLCRQLAAAAERGVTVQVILDHSDPQARWPGPDNSEPAAWLRQRGVSVHFDEIDVRSHTKMLVIDQQLVVGSHNWTRSALTGNRESSILSRNPQLLAAAEDLLADIQLDEL
jgi:phosphatidylserine/phosphatidylglycerophosphate/cardiolipin synthase-like enzyme